MVECGSFRKVQSDTAQDIHLLHALLLHFHCSLTSIPFTTLHSRISIPYRKLQRTVSRHCDGRDMFSFAASQPHSTKEEVVRLDYSAHMKDLHSLRSVVLYSAYVD